MSRRTQKNVGVIGLGIIGSRVAANLRRGGFHAFVWNRTPRPFPNFVGSRSEVAELCDFIQIFVSDDDALIETIEQIKRSLKAHHVVMAHCTVAPGTMRAAAEIVQRKGAQFLDAPFTGSKMAAQKGELVYYIGGDAGTFERARPVLQASSKQIIEIGEIGQATTIKLATNMITATTVQATAEALALVHSAGLSPEKFATAMEGNGSQSGTLAMKLPNMISGNFEPHFSTKHMFKDVQIASRLARSNDLNFGAMEAARDSLRREMEQGRGDYDYASMVRAYFPDGIPKQEAPEPAVEDQQDLAGLDETPAAESLNGTTDKPPVEPKTTVPEEPEGEPPQVAAEPVDDVLVEEEIALEGAAAEADGNEPETAANAPFGEAPSTAVDEPTFEATENEGAQPEEGEPVTAGSPTAPVPTSVDNAEARRGFLSRVFGRSGEQ